MTSKLIKDLKNLFHSFIYYKYDDETNFHNWISENVSYGDGVYVNHSNMDQDVKVSFATVQFAPGFSSGNLRIYVSPGVQGQSVIVEYAKTSDGSSTSVTLSTDSNGYCYFFDRFYRARIIRVTVQPKDFDGVSYSGGGATYQL